MNNPFNITKAVDYTDEQLNSSWVDFPNISFKETVKPTSDMPMIILGSKGSGKTHIMRHFSFTMQCLRYKGDLRHGLLEDGYIGTYLRCSGLNGYKFSDRGEPDSVWETYFAYYLELWLGQLILNNLSKLVGVSKFEINEKKIVNDIINLFDHFPSDHNIETIIDLVKQLSLLQKAIDYAINNRALTKKKISESVEVLASAGSLIFGIPLVFSDQVSDLKDLKFLYLLDEYENFTEPQQRYFNTLIRERKSPVCFKIGARRYGIRTRGTLSAGEEIKGGSEYEELDIDNTFRENSLLYRDFLEKICINRLENCGILVDQINLKKYFETFEEEKFFEKIAIKGKIHLNKFRSNLDSSKFQGDSKEVMKNLEFDKNLILERANIMLAYRALKNGKNPLEESMKIRDSCLEFYKNPKSEGQHEKILGKYKNDLIDILARENNLKFDSYSGLSNLVKISNGIPRHFLIIMKHIFRWNAFYDKNIFSDISIPADEKSQLNAIKDTGDWFIEDARIPGNDGNKIKDCIERLCGYLRELRFSNLPPECSISSFSIDSKVIPSEISDILNYLEQYSYIIKVGSGRRDKNLNSRNQTFQINGLLAVEWELSLARRGILNFGYPEIQAIFAPKDESDFRKLLNHTLGKYNFPFPLNSNLPSLFD